jgi:hypothetical protein
MNLSSYTTITEAHAKRRRMKKHRTKEKNQREEGGDSEDYLKAPSSSCSFALNSIFTGPLRRLTGW